MTRDTLISCSMSAHHKKALEFCGHKMFDKGFVYKFHESSVIRKRY